MFQSREGGDGSHARVEHSLWPAEHSLWPAEHSSGTPVTGNGPRDFIFKLKNNMFDLENSNNIVVANTNSARNTTVLTCRCRAWSLLMECHALLQMIDREAVKMWQCCTPPSEPTLKIQRRCKNAEIHDTLCVMSRSLQYSYICCRFQSWLVWYF